MYRVNIYDSQKNLFRTYEHIEKVSYSDALDEVEVSGDKLLTHKFHLCFDLCLFSKAGNYTVSSRLLGAIEIEKE